jgi:hypothetical protein
MIYRDNIDYEFYSLFPEEDTRSKYLSLYKREFFGIDKECDEQSEEFKFGYDKLKKSQESEKLLLLIEPILFICGFFSLIVLYRICSIDVICGIILIQYLLLFGTCTICHSIFLSQIIHSDLPPYECSDKITNEVLRKENLNTKKTIIFTAINLGADILIILINIFPFLFPKLGECCDSFFDFILCKNCKIYKEKTINNHMRDVNINNNKNKNDTERNTYSSEENNKVVKYKNKNQFNSPKYSDNNSDHNVTQDLNKDIDSKSKI